MPAKSDFQSYFKVIWVVQSPSQKYSAFHPAQISGYLAPSGSHKRAFRDRHERWERDAMDAAARETSVAAAYDQVVWS
jgi:hypothetical protein